jgi:foldase protein PrsA
MKRKKLAAFCLAGALAASMLTGCSINKNATAATFSDGTTVSLGVVNFAMRYQQAALDEVYRMYFGDDAWSTYEDTMKSSVMDDFHDLYTLKIHMADYDVSLTEDEEQEILDAANAFLEANDASTLKEIGADQSTVVEYLTLYKIQEKMTAAIKAEADTTVTDEEANMRAYTMLCFSTAGSYDSDYNYVELTDEEVAAVEEQAKAAYAEITSPSDIETVADEYGLTATNGTYDADDTSLADEVKTALDGLSEGEMSELVTTDSGYYILRLDAETDEEATETNRESIIEEKQDDHYDEILSGWQENDGWTVKDRQIAKIEFRNIFTAPEEESTEDTETEDTETEAADTETEATDTEAEDTETVDTETEGTEKTETAQ